MSLSKGRTQQTVEALKQLLCGVSSKLVTSLGTCAQRGRGKKKKKKSTGFTNRMGRNVNLSDTNFHLRRALHKNIPWRNIKTVPCHQYSKLTVVSAEPCVNIESILHNNSFM